MRAILLLFTTLIAVLAGPVQAAPEKTAVFAGGCFWCTEHDFEQLPGVIDAVSGYAGGHVKNPTYEQVSSGTTGHVESVEVHYDPARVSYRQLVEWFWRHVNPTDPGGQFVDRGSQYRTVIFYQNDEQKRIAEASKEALSKSGHFKKPIVTEIRPLKHFYRAEAYHQDFYKHHPLKYKYYRYRSGRDQFIDKHWKHPNRLPSDTKGTANAASDQARVWHGGKDFRMPDKATLKKELTPLQYSVTQEDDTEPAFHNAYWDNHEPGIYVDVVSGQPLFSSTDKFKSGTGWPSFTRPIRSDAVKTKRDFKLFLPRTEVRSSLADSHLGHVFDDGPQPTGKRYCIDSAALRFVPKSRMKQLGYGEYLKLFDQKGAGRQ